MIQYLFERLPKLGLTASHEGKIMAQQSLWVLSFFSFQRSTSFHGLLSPCAQLGYYHSAFQCQVDFFVAHLLRILPFSPWAYSTLS